MASIAEQQLAYLEHLMSIPKRRKLRKDPELEKVVINIDVRTANGYHLSKSCEMTVKEIINQCCLYTSPRGSEQIVFKIDVMKKRNKTELTVSEIKKIINQQNDISN
jgi:ribosomal protein L5